MYSLHAYAQHVLLFMPLHAVTSGKRAWREDVARSSTCYTRQAKSRKNTNSGSSNELSRRSFGRSHSDRTLQESECCLLPPVTSKVLLVCDYGAHRLLSHWWTTVILQNYQWPVRTQGKMFVNKQGMSSSISLLRILLSSATHHVLKDLAIP